jgi:hypothetical protein
LARWAGSRSAQTGSGCTRAVLWAAVILEISAGLDDGTAWGGRVGRTDCHQIVTIGGRFRPFGALSSGCRRKKMPGKFGTYRASSTPSAGLKILVSAVQSRPSPPFISFTHTHLHAADFQPLTRVARTLGRNLADHARLGASLMGITVRSAG